MKTSAAPARTATIWYLGHSGWAIQTGGHFLVFDYWRGDILTEKFSMENNRFHPTGLKHEEVYVFVSHKHMDHYNPAILEWTLSSRPITYVFGWPAREIPNCICMRPRENQRAGLLEITAIASTDAGVGFVVSVDGLVILHGGDAAQWLTPFSFLFRREVDFLARRGMDFDMVFLAVATGQGRRRDCITNGALYAMAKLAPRVMFPMHAMGKEHHYAEFAREAERRSLKTDVLCAAKPGDSFLYSREKDAGVR